MFTFEDDKYTQKSLPLKTFAFPIPKLKETKDYIEKGDGSVYQGFSINGLFPDGRPFLALKWKVITEDYLAVGIDIFFSRKELKLKRTDELFGENTLPMTDTVECQNGGLNLCESYPSSPCDEVEEEIPDDMWYSLLDYLERMGIISFDGCKYENCAANYIHDDNDEEIIICKITLYENGENLGYCPIKFPNFTIHLASNTSVDDYEFEMED